MWKCNLTFPFTHANKQWFVLGKLMLIKSSLGVSTAGTKPAAVNEVLFYFVHKGMRQASRINKCKWRESNTSLLVRWWLVTENHGEVDLHLTSTSTLHKQWTSSKYNLLLTVLCRCCPCLHSVSYLHLIFIEAKQNAVCCMQMAMPSLIAVHHNCHNWPKWHDDPDMLIKTIGCSGVSLCCWKATFKLSTRLKTFKAIGGFHMRFISGNLCMPVLFVFWFAYSGM